MTKIAAAGTFRLANVFGKAAAIYRRRFVPFIILTIMASIPTYIGVLAFGYTNGTGMLGSMNPSSWAEAWLSLDLLNFVTESLGDGAVIYGALQELRGRAFSTGASIQVALGRFLPLLGITICISVGVTLGVTLLVIPGLIFNCLFYVALPVCVAEQRGVSASMSRSRSLTRGYRLQVFGTVLLLQIAGFILVAIVPRILEIARILEISGLAGNITISAGLMAIALAPGAIFNAFNYALAGVFYWELRVAREGVDIDKITTVFD